MILRYNFELMSISERFELLRPNIPNFLQWFLESLTTRFILIFPFLLSLTIVIINISLIWGGITFLLNFNEKDGKMMIIRSFAVLVLVTYLFKPSNSSHIEFLRLSNDLLNLTFFITSYLLFIFAALSIITFIGNLGLYLLSSNSKRIDNLKKSTLCFICAILPLGLQFPFMPVWIV
jgi:hypothetical protein